MKVTVERSIDALPVTIFEARHPHRSEARWRSLGADVRFTPAYLVAWTGGVPVAVLPVYSSNVESWHDAAYLAAAGLHEAQPSEAQSRFAFVAGWSDYQTVYWVHPQLDEVAQVQTLSRLLESAVEVVGPERVPILPFCRSQSALANACRSIGWHEGRPTYRYVIEDAKDSPQAFAMSLTRSHRSVVRRDLRKVQKQLDLTACEGWEWAVSHGPELFANVALRHGARTHPRLIRHRLSGWCDDREARRITFTAQSRSGESALAIGWVFDETIELYEVGLPKASTPDRHLLYLGCLIYAPLHYMHGQGLQRLDLGMQSGQTKMLRGAVEVAVVSFVA